MKYLVGLLSLSALLVLAFAAPISRAAQTPGPAPAQSESQVQATQLAATNAQVANLTKDLADTRALLARTVAYLNAQAHSATELATVLDEAEVNGFAVGENNRSRQILLAGWRSALAVQQENVPQLSMPAGPELSRKLPPKPVNPKPVSK